MGLMLHDGNQVRKVASKNISVKQMLGFDVLEFLLQKILSFFKSC